MATAGATTAAKTPTLSASKDTPTDFAIFTLQDLGKPVTTQNVNLILTWLGNEQNTSSWSQDIANNPLGIMDASGIIHYGSIQEGAAATANELQSGSYTNIVNSLSSGSTPLSMFATAVVNSPWNKGSGHGVGSADPNYGGVAKFMSAATVFVQGALITGPTQSNSTTALGGTLSASQSSAVTSALQAEGATPGEIGQILSTIENDSNPSTLLLDPLSLASSAVDLFHVQYPGEGIVNGVSSVSGLIGDVTNPARLKNVGIFALGVVCIVGGLVIFFISTKEGQALQNDVISTAGKSAGAAA